MSIIAAIGLALDSISTDPFFAFRFSDKRSGYLARGTLADHLSFIAQT
jgi:hypothetical protein